MSGYKGGRIENKSLEDKDKGCGRFASGVAILTLSTFLVKVFGVLCKIPMIKILREEGMGYFNSAYEIYTFFYIIASAGLPVAVSILIASCVQKKQYRNVNRIYRVSMIIFIVIGLFGTCAMYFGAERFSHAIENSNSLLCIMAISPMAFFVCISGGIRGYFQGHSNMVPTAISQIVESAFKMLLGLAFGFVAIKRGYSLPQSAAFATFGLSLAASISMLYLICAKAIKGRKLKYKSDDIPEKNRIIAKNIIRIAVPITISSTIISLTRVVDLVMIMKRLQAIGYSENVANSIYGSYSTLAISMFNLPASFVMPIGLSLVPFLTSAVKAKNKEKEYSTLNSSLRLCGLMAIPSTFGMALFSRPILELVFHDEISAVKIAAPLLSVLSMSVFFSCIMTITNSALQAYSQERKPILSMTIGAAVKIISSYILIGIPSINIYGAPISTVLCSVTVCAINFIFVKKCAPEMENVWNLFSRSIYASFTSVLIGGALYAFIAFLLGESAILTVCTIMIVALMYGFFAFKMGAISEADILLLPKGEKFSAFLKKIKLIR